MRQSKQKTNGIGSGLARKAWRDTFLLNQTFGSIFWSKLSLSNLFAPTPRSCFLEYMLELLFRVQVTGLWPGPLGGFCRYDRTPAPSPKPRFQSGSPTSTAVDSRTSALKMNFVRHECCLEIKEHQPIEIAFTTHYFDGRHCNNAYRFNTFESICFAVGLLRARCPLRDAILLHRAHCVGFSFFCQFNRFLLLLVYLGTKGLIS